MFMSLFVIILGGSTPSNSLFFLGLVRLWMTQNKIMIIFIQNSFQDYGSRSPGANDAHDPKKQLGGGR